MGVLSLLIALATDFQFWVVLALAGVVPEGCYCPTYLLCHASVGRHKFKL